MHSGVGLFWLTSPTNPLPYMIHFLLSRTDTKKFPTLLYHELHSSFTNTLCFSLKQTTVCMYFKWMYVINRCISKCFIHFWKPHLINSKTAAFKTISIMHHQLSELAGTIWKYVQIMESLDGGGSLSIMHRHKDQFKAKCLDKREFRQCLDNWGFAVLGSFYYVTIQWRVKY